MKKSPFKKAGEYIKRMSNLSNSGDNDRSDLDYQDNVFQVAECSNNEQRFYSDQLKDTYGKDSVDECMVMKVTGAKEMLKKPRRDRIGIFGDNPEVNIMDLLQMFRESQELHRGRENQGGGHSLPHMLMAMAQSDNDGEGSGDESISSNLYREEFEDSSLGNNFSLMQINQVPGQRDGEQNRSSASHVFGSSSGSRPSFGPGFRRGSDRSDQLIIGSSSS